MLSRRSRRVLTLVPAAAALVVTSACGSVTAAPSSQSPADAGYAQANSGNAAAAPQGQQPAGGGQQQEPVPYGGQAANRILAASQSAQLGAFVVNGNGFALYRFDKDTAKPPKSNCEGECTKTWTPMIANGQTMVSELDAGLLGTVARADGSTQVTYAGWPLYSFTGDRSPGRTSGQGKGGTWWLITPDGKKVAGAATPPPSGSATPGSGATGY